MSIQVSCECGKQFEVGDQYAGKRGRCKACGRIVTVPAASAPQDDPFSATEPEVAPLNAPSPPSQAANPPPAFPEYPGFKSRDRGEKQVGGVRIHLHPAIIALIVLAIGIPVLIFTIEQGPVKARDQWQKIEPTAEVNVASQITRAIQHVYKQFDIGDEDRDLSRHKALSVAFDEPAIMFRLPDSMQIQGRTTEGNYTGEFHPRSMHFEVNVPIAGSSHKISGSVSDDDRSLDLDGQPIQD
jgi:hypothetical protein